MGIALLAFSGFFQGLTAFQRATPAAISNPSTVKRLRPVWPNRHTTCSPSGVTLSVLRTSPSSANAAAPYSRPPLRVMRVTESGQRTAGAGRMVISGRMADVCAELDRLAALEAMHTPT
jgi:hypothetical protein